MLYLLAFVLSLIATACRIFTAMFAWNLFMPHFGLTKVGFVQTYILGMVLSLVSGSAYLDFNHLTSEDDKGTKLAKSIAKSGLTIMACIISAIWLVFIHYLVYG